MKGKLFLGLALACAALFTVVGCAPGDGPDDPTEGSFPHAASEYVPTKDGLIEENIIDDKYDSYYQIFVYSFCDSNNDDHGDLNGITSKLEYLRGMGYTGIWLTPITKGGAIHKYDVTDYKTVDPTFGTIADFDKLVKRAHELGIKVILDMVFNHTSIKHEWFTNCVKAFLSNDRQNRYYDYYTLSKTSSGLYKFSKRYNYNNSMQTVYFESSQGQQEMPDLNLDSPHVKQELQDIIEFWMSEHDVDGFRLDACKNYFNNNTKSAQYVSWIKEEACKYNPNAYIVGEVYDNESVISSYYSNSTGDSFLWFPEAYFPSWSWPNKKYPIVSCTKQAVSGSSAGVASAYFNAMSSMVSKASGGIPAPFLDSHDTDRVADGAFDGNETMVKFGQMLFAMYTGNTFTYYGDEIGAMGTREQDSMTDVNRRLGMLWCKDDLENHPPIFMNGSTPNYAFEGVVEQIKDPTSILNVVKKCNNARNAFPALMRGAPTRVTYDDDAVLVMRKTYSGQSPITIVINFANTTKTVSTATFTEKALKWNVSAKGGDVTAEGTSLSMPALSIAILG